MPAASELGLGILGYPSASDAHHRIKVRKTQFQSVFELIRRWGALLQDGVVAERNGRPVLFTNCATGDGVDAVVDAISRAVLFDRP